MKNLFIILFSLFSLLGFSQEDPVNPSRTKADFYFLKDTYGRIITTESGGILSVIQVEDTASSELVLPPDTAQVFDITLAASDTFSSLRTEIRSYWTLEESSGDAVDSVNNYDLSLHGTVTQGETGIVGDCYSFATDGFLDSIPNVFNFPGPFTLSCWYNGNDEDLYSGLMTNFGIPDYGWELIIFDSDGVGGNPGVVRADLRIPGTNVQLSGSTAINDDSWHNIMLTLGSDDTAKIWVDGSIEDLDKLSGPISYIPGCVFSLGSRLGGQYFLEGKLDEVITWNRELTDAEIDSVVAKVQYPFTTGGSGGDSLTMVITGEDTRADTMYVLWKYTGWSTDTTDGNLQFRFGMDEIEDYRDTTFLWTGRGDTIVYFTAFTKFGVLVTPKGNQDTVFVDSSDRTPPDQDVGIWDIVMEQDWEHRAAPAYWALDTFKQDVPLSIGRYGDQWYRSEELRFPQWWSDNVDDSIVIDPVTGSKVLRTMWRGGYHDNYDGTSYRGGEYWKEGFPDGAKYTELYSSINIKMSSGFFANQYCGGKIAPGLPGGTPITTLGTPPYGEGYWYCVSWGFQGEDLGSLAFYLYYQGQTHEYGQWFPWDDFQPTGGGIEAGDYNSTGKWIWPDDTEEWINITVRCVTNTHTGSNPNYDGILEGYVNGRLVAQISGLYLITYPDIGNEINYYQFYQAVGGGNQPPMPRNDITMWSYNDDIVVFTYDVSVDVPRGNELSQPGRILSLPNWPKTE